MRPGYYRSPHWPDRVVALDTVRDADSLNLDKEGWKDNVIFALDQSANICLGVVVCQVGVD